MKLQLAFLLALGALTLAPSLAHATPRKPPARHWVKTYTRKNGTVVQGHWAGSGFSSATPSRSSRSGHSDYVPGSIGNIVAQDKFLHSDSSGNPSDHLYDTYAQDPTLEPSWVREQRREKAEQATQQAYLRSSKSKTPSVASRKKAGTTKKNTHGSY